MAVKLTCPAFFTATCPNCEATRTYTLEDGDPERGEGVYECEDCGKEARLDLDP
mgnify:CR=1 FL=1